ncbi:MAG TPA: hypothetical protein VN253_10285 [Kofleriaceae bacterium]|nr:hypothetical protein [Kofleriaceae bacterium]
MVLKLAIGAVAAAAIVGRRSRWCSPPTVGEIGERAAPGRAPRRWWRSA